MGVVLGYYLVCYNHIDFVLVGFSAVVPGYYLVCYNYGTSYTSAELAVVPGYYLVCYNRLLVKRLLESL